MNHTTNYQLSQWEKSDKVQMEDFNADNVKIDAAIKAVEQKADGLVTGKADAAALSTLSQTVSAHGAAITKFGDCQIYTRTYTGNGTYGAGHARTLTFSYPPKLVAVTGPNGVFMIMVYGSPAALFPNSSPPPCRAYVSWYGNSVSWYGEYIEGHMNLNGETYYVTALCSKS